MTYFVTMTAREARAADLERLPIVELFEQAYSDDADAWLVEAIDVIDKYATELDPAEFAVTVQRYLTNARRHAVEAILAEDDPE